MSRSLVGKGLGREKQIPSNGSVDIVAIPPILIKKFSSLNVLMDGHSSSECVEKAQKDLESLPVPGIASCAWERLLCLGPCQQQSCWSQPESATDDTSVEANERLQAAATATAAAAGQWSRQLPQPRRNQHIRTNLYDPPVLTLPQRSVQQTQPFSEINKSDFEETVLYVNSKQFRQIIKRREKRQKLREKYGFSW